MSSFEDINELVDGIYEILAKNDCTCSDCWNLNQVSSLLAPVVNAAKIKRDKFVMVTIAYMLGTIFCNRQQEGIGEINQLIKQLEFSPYARQNGFST